LKKGSGRPARDGDEISVRYFNLAFKGHRIYEDNWRQQYGPFVLGGGQMVEAWEDGLSGIKAGGRRELVVPGGRTTLENKPEIYVVEAVSVTRAKKSASAKAPEIVVPTGAKPRITADLGQPPTRLVVRVLKRGSGGRVRRGEQLGARFIDFNYKTGRVQDFWGDGQTDPAPYGFVLGEGEVRKGWEIALPGQRLGTRLELLLPSRLAYQNGAMRYVVELIEREKSTPGRGG
jgi:FKBP-type peptidyl-prolyl cis-trans isomerase